MKLDLPIVCSKVPRRRSVSLGEPTAGKIFLDFLRWHGNVSVGEHTILHWAVKPLPADYCARCYPTRRTAISRLQQEFQRIVDAHYGSLWSYVNLLTGGSPDSEDVVHQAFLLAFDRLAGDDRTIEDMGKWLRGVVRNLVRAWWREKRRLPQHLADQIYELAEEAENPSDRLARAELTEALQRCLNQLAPAARRFVAARYEQGLPIHQIAHQEDLNVATARVRLFRIRDTLRTCLESHLAEGVVS